MNTMLENAPPALLDAIKLIATLKLLANPEGLHQIAAELEKLTQDALAAHKKLGTRQKEIAAAEASLVAAQQQHTAGSAELDGKRQAAEAALERLDRRTEKLDRDRGEHREAATALGRDQAALRQR